MNMSDWDVIDQKIDSMFDFFLLSNLEAVHIQLYMPRTNKKAAV